jgi:hypothetical protein
MNKTSITVDKKHAALWQQIDGKWRMTPIYLELWCQWQKGKISRATFFRRKQTLKEAYDALQAP